MINIVQYHGEPLTHLELIGSFDLPPPQVAVCVDAGTARPRFVLTAAAAEAIRTRELRFNEYTWGPCYSYLRETLRQDDDDDAPELPDFTPLCVLAGPVRVQLERINKYERRGFKLPGAAASVD